MYVIVYIRFFVFDFLTTKFTSAFNSITGKKKINRSSIEDIIAQIEDALLQADVPYEVVKSFVATIADEVVGQKIIGSLKPAEQFMKLVHDKMIEFMGGAQQQELAIKSGNTVIVMGLQGSGKTTTCAKLIRQLEKNEKIKKVLLASVDFYRPAAIDQLEVLAQKLNNTTFYRAQNSCVVSAVQEIKQKFSRGNYDLLVIDTAGRLHIDESMLQELKLVVQTLQPQHKLLVIDSMTGQESLTVARSFNDQVGFDYAILTKTDSDSRGGSAFAFNFALQKSIAFIGLGEKLDDLQKFHVDRFVKRILGQGDLLSLAEKADKYVDEQEQKASFDRLISGTFTLEDFSEQMSMMNSMGSLSSLMKYMPGMGNMKLSDNDLERGEHELKNFRAIISSMTKKERLLPLILCGSRKKRISCGAGVKVQEVNLLLSRFKEMQKFATFFKKGGPFSGLFG
jgi:signal recognition particle subunit SRP54